MADRDEQFARPKARRRFTMPKSQDRFGRFTESFARAMGTPAFLIGMTIFVTFWLGYNSIVPAEAQFDPQSQGFPLLTLVLSLQASYAAPLLLLAQNRQDDRDRVSMREDRQRAERNLSDTEYLTREIADLRIALREVATRDYVRSELRSILEELLETTDGQELTLQKRKPRKPSDNTVTLPKVQPAGRKPSR